MMKFTKTMNATLISCALALAGIIIFILMITFLDERSFRDMGWILAGMLALAIITIAGLIFSIIAIITEKNVLSWISALVFLLPIFVVAGNAGREFFWRHRETETKFEELSHWKIEASTVIVDKPNERLIDIRGIGRADGKDSADLPQVGKDDFFIRFWIFGRNSSENKHYILHVIPANGSYKTKLLMEHDESGKKWHEDDELCGKVLNYYLVLQSEMDGKKQKGETTPQP